MVNFKILVEFFSRKKLMPRTIRGKIILGFSLFVVMMLLMAAVNQYHLLQINKSVRVLEKAEEFNALVLEIRRYEKNFIIYHEESDFLENRHYLKMAQKLLDGRDLEDSSFINPALRKELLLLLSEYETLINSLHNISIESHGGTSAPNWVVTQDELRILGKRLVTHAEKTGSSERSNIERTMQSSFLLTFTILLLTLLIVLFLANLMTKKIVGPLRYIENTTKRLAEGDYTPIPSIKKTKDEIFSLIQAFNKMIAELEERQEQLLIQAYKISDVGTLTSGIAHELNNPITNVYLTAEFLIENYETLNDEEKKKMLAEIITQGERVSSTVKNLLDFTRIRPLKQEKIQISTVIDETLRLVDNELRLNNIELQNQYASNLPLISCNRHNLQQVFMNLFINAIHAMEGGGILRVVTSLTNNNYVKIDVIDNGCGIKKEHLQRVFEPFFTTKEVGRGTGMGLAVSFNIINKHGGKIKVTSEEGKGTNFSVYLPAVKEENKDPVKAA